MKHDNMNATGMTNCPLAQLFLKQVTLKPQAPALISDDKVLSFSDLYKHVNALKEAFTHGGGDGELIVGIACTSAEAEICSVLATLLADACFVPLDEQLPAARMMEVIEDAHPGVIVVSGQTAEVPTPRSLLRHSSEISAVFLEVDDSGRLQHGAVAGPSGVDGGGRARSLPTTRRESPSPAKGCKAEILDTLARSEAASVHIQRPTSSVRQSSQEIGSSSCLPRGDVDNGVVYGVDQADEDGLLYIMYTSGTTGKPKGVRGTRAGAMNRLRFGWSEFPYRDVSELVARRTPSCFVDFVAEVFSPLLAGVPIYIPPRGAANDPLWLVPAMTRSRATRVTLTPSLLSSLLRIAESRPGPLLPDLHTCFVSGEALHRDLAVRFRRQAASGAQLVNMYGSTEVAGDATYCTLDDILESSSGRARSPADATDVVDEGVLIGRPLPGTHVSIVDSTLRTVGAGHPGELVVGGSGVARGYHRRPSETAEKFMVSQGCGGELNGGKGVCIPGIPHGERMVRMGDRVVQLSTEGPLFWLGRLDSEVKIHGVRVSLDEVERLMCSAGRLPAGASAAVWDPGKVRETPATAASAGESSTITKAPDRGRLLGFVTQEGMRKAGHTLPSLRRTLEQEMSTAQLPALLLPVSRAFPLTPTGKVDKGALLRECMLRGSRPPERLSETVVADDPAAVLDQSPTGEGPSTEQRSYAAAKAAIARALDEVLPDAREQTAAWLIGVHPEALDPLEPAYGPELTFAELGGTSLLAVEAAWLSSRFFIQDNMSPSAALTVPPNLLDAADFLHGTLEGVARTLGSRTIPATGAGGPAVANGAETTAVSSNTPKVPSSGTESRASSSDLPVAMLPGSIDNTRELPGLSVARGVKRRLGDKDGAGAPIFRLGERSEVIAIGRAGVGLIRSPGCSRSAEESAETGKEIGTWAGVEAESVRLRRSWSSGMKKCIDGTPLIVVSDSSGIQYSDGGERTVAEANHPGPGSKSCAHAVENDRASLSSPVPGVVNAEFLEGFVYIGSHSGEFQALGLETGRRRWSVTLGNRVEAGACCSPDGSLVLVGCHDRRLYALDRDTGAVVWAFETRDVIKCTPVCVPTAGRSVSRNDPGPRGEGAPVGILADAVLCGSHDGVLRCLSLANGELVWQFDCGGALYASPAHDTDARVVYAATTKGRLLAVARASAAPPDEGDDADEGHGTVIPDLHLASENPSERRKPGNAFVLWSHQLPGPCFSTPAVSPATGTVVVGCVDGVLYCFSSEGERLWAHRQGRKAIFSSPCLIPWLERGFSDSDIGKKDTGLRVAWGCHDGKLRFGSGTRVYWETDIGKGHPVFSSPFVASVECAGCAQPLPLLFACATSGLIVAARLSDGVVAGEMQLPGEVFSSPVVIRRRLVVGCRDDKVYAMDLVALCSRCTARSEH